MPTYETKFGIGDRLVIAYPHTVKTKKPSFPDWEEVITQCPGHHTVTITEILIRPKGDAFGGIQYMFYNATPCECGRKDAGNCINEDSEYIEGLVK